MPKLIKEQNRFVFMSGTGYVFLHKQLFFAKTCR